MNQQNKQPEKQKEHRFDPELLKKGYKCDLDQYEMLKRCSDAKNITEWNQWRKKHPDEEIWLEGADLTGIRLDGIIFNNQEAHDRGSNVYLKKAILRKASLKNSKLNHAYLEEAKFNMAKLQHSDFHDAHVQGTIFFESEIQEADFHNVIVDGETSFCKCKVNRYTKNKKYTNFEVVGLDNCRIEPSIKQLLEYNIRRKNWESWYRDEDEPIQHGVFIFKNKKIRLITNKVLTWFVRKFWWISDYGISTKRIIFTFFGLAFAFAIIYYAFGLIDSPGIVSNLFVIENTQEIVASWLVPFRAVYFSIVTMTTLGFGDMYANAQSIWGHIFLTIQVILGYVLMGALVTRFAVLFTAGGPAGKFADEKENKEKN